MQKDKSICDNSFAPLTHYQTTNFRLLQTERVCRRQFQIWRKWQKVIQMGRKHCGKRRNCSLRCFQKACLAGASKGVTVWEGVNSYHTTFYNCKSSKLWKTTQFRCDFTHEIWLWWNADYKHFLIFPQCFQKSSSIGSLRSGIVW